MKGFKWTHDDDEISDGSHRGLFVPRWFPSQFGIRCEAWATEWACPFSGRVMSPPKFIKAIFVPFDAVGSKMVRFSLPSSIKGRKSEKYMWAIDGWDYNECVAASENGSNPFSAVFLGWDSE